jgi:magnesium chelatase subunit D
VLFVVDASDSMGARRRLAVVKRSVLAMLRRAYQGRHKVAVVAFGGEEGRVLLRPTAGVSVARRALLKLRPEGATPMAAGIERAVELLHRVEARGAADFSVTVLLSDGEANVPARPGGDPRTEVLQLLPRLRRLSAETLFIDTKAAGRGGGESEMLRFARAAGGRYYGPAELSAGSLVAAVSRAEVEGGGRAR